MIDPRYVNAAPVPMASGYGGAQQMPMQYHYQHHRHHGHHKHKNRNDESPVSRDESIHKVDHGHHHHHHIQNEEIPLGSGYGVPYSTGGFQHQQQFGDGNFGYANQYQGDSYGQGSSGVQTVKHRRRHHRHNRHHAVEAANVGGADPAHGVPEQLIGQRSSSVLSNQEQPVRSPAPQHEGDAGNVHGSHHRHHHHHHHRHHHERSENASFGHVHQSRQTQGHTTAGADGYGHINEDLIFIERGDQSPHRQEPPSGYEYKGKIEVQGVDKEIRSRSHGHESAPQTYAAPAQPYAVPAQQYAAPAQSYAQTASCGPCPSGWEQMLLSAGGAGPCLAGGLPFTGQAAGVASSSGGYGSFGGSYPISSNYQFSTDYCAGFQQAGFQQTGYQQTGYQQTGNTGYPQIDTTGYQQTGGTSGFTEQHQKEHTEEHTTSRATVIEVWQKKSKGGEVPSVIPGERPRITSTGEAAPFDFDRFRNEILAAIGRIPRAGPTEGPSVGRETQTQIRPTGPGETRVEYIKQESGPGEVRVIVQPIQPVFYMPRQTAETTTQPIQQHIPQIGPGPAPAPIQQQIPISSGGGGGAPQIVYVPRNVYVPVIKPVFVPRERVIIRPQVIHVARPVLVDRPVPVTQRPIIIDRERPIPVPVRGGGQGATHSGGSRVVKEEFVYRDNLPVAYGGRCAEFSGGASFGYVPNQQQQQQHYQEQHHREQHYSANSTQEAGGLYQAEASAVNVNIPAQYQQSQSGSHLNVQTGGSGAGSFHGSYSNLAEVNNAAGINIGQNAYQQSFEQSAQVTASGGGRASMEVLDAAVNPNWIKTDQSSLVRRYGRPAYEIVHKSEEVEQQMYSEIRQRTSSEGIARSASSASYASGSGIEISGGGGSVGYAQF